jgi:hypothetical protein
MKIKWTWNPFKAKQAMQAAGDDLKTRCAQHMAERARHYAPVDTGHLQAEIQVVAPSGSKSAHVIAGADYSQWVEFGHLAGGVAWVAPNPFMRRALADTAKAFPDIAKGVRLARPGVSDVPNLGATFKSE